MTRADAIATAKKQVAEFKTRQFSYGEPESDSELPSPPKSTPRIRPSARQSSPGRTRPSSQQSSPGRTRLRGHLDEALGHAERFAANAKAERERAIRMLAEQRRQFAVREAELKVDLQRGNLPKALTDLRSDIARMRQELRNAQKLGESGASGVQALQKQIERQENKLRKLGSQQATSTMQEGQSSSTTTNSAASASQTDAGATAAREQRRAESRAAQLRERQRRLRQRNAANGAQPQGEASSSDPDSSAKEEPVRAPTPAHAERLFPSRRVTPAANPRRPTAPVSQPPRSSNRAPPALPVPKKRVQLPAPKQEARVDMGEDALVETESETAPLVKTRRYNSKLGTRKPLDKSNLFDRFMAYASPSFNDDFCGFLKLTMMMLIAQILNCIGVLIFCVLNSDEMYWQLNVFSYHDRKLSWSAAFGWMALVVCIIGVVYEGFVFGMRRRLYNPSALEGSLIDPVDIPHRQLDKDAENYWWFAGAIFGIFDSSILVFMGANGILTMVDFIALGLVAWYIIKQADSRYDLLDDRVAIENLSMAIGMKIYVVARVVVMYSISSSGTLETSWAGDDLSAVFFLYFVVMIMTLLMVMVFRRSPLFPLVRDLIMLMIVCSCSWVIATSSTSRDNLPGAICSHTVKGC